MAKAAQAKERESRYVACGYDLNSPEPIRIIMQQNMVIHLTINEAHQIAAGLVSILGTVAEMKR